MEDSPREVYPLRNRAVPAEGRPNQDDLQCRFGREVGCVRRETVKMDDAIPADIASSQSRRAYTCEYEPGRWGPFPQGMLGRKAHLGHAAVDRTIDARV